MVLAGIQKLTLLDYPGHLAATLFTPGCNFRCPFCHNASLVSESGKTILADGSNCDTLIDPSEVLDFLKERFGRLQGVAITGGEPTMQQDLPDFISEIKKLGYKVKLDTNGSYPDRLGSILEAGLADYVAMDIKNCWEKYETTAGLKVLDADFIDFGTDGPAIRFGGGKVIEKGGFGAAANQALPKIVQNCQRSVEMLKSFGVEHEFRTTVVKQLHELSDIEKMAQSIGPEEKYFLQNFVDSGDIIGSNYCAHDRQTLLQFLEAARKYCPKTELRGVD